MAKITLQGVHPFDGEYELDTSRAYNGHELHFIKQVSGVRMGEIEAAADAGDYDLLVAVTVIAMWRAGKIERKDLLTAADVLLGAEAGKLMFAEDDARPPDETTKPAGSSDTSSPDSPSSSGRPEKTPTPTGSRGSETDSASDLVTSGT